MDEMKLTQAQWDELSASVAAGDRAKVQRQLAALFIVYQTQQRKAAEDARRQCRRNEPWIPNRF